MYKFSEIIYSIDLTSYFVDKKGYKTGHPRYSYIKLLKIMLFSFMENGKGKRKTNCQRRYKLLKEYIEKLCTYAKHIEICGKSRNSYSKTDKDATFMRIKRDYIGNDQLLPAYNIQVAVCDEYIATFDVKQYASDTECFVPLMGKFNNFYGPYPKYPVTDAGYGSYNNYIYVKNMVWKSI